MDLQLTGKRALVTGASSGLGAEIAVVVHGRDQARSDAKVTYGTDLTIETIPSYIDIY
jgi:NAD(P)-dependent dehydrogenase (short-subunit alcohol dehydrogenase family)